jgi:hypothetical protein
LNRYTKDRANGKWISHGTRMTKESRELELLVQKIQQQLAPNAEVLHDVHLPGRFSKRTRQIDVLVRQKIGQYEMLIVLDCKDHARPIDVTGVEGFNELVGDVGAHKGALICPKGFTAAAKERAKGYGVDLYSPIDTDPHKWQVKIAVPMLCDFREAQLAFRISSIAAKPFRMPYLFQTSLVAFDTESKRELGLPIDVALDRWNRGELPSEPGEHSDLLLFEKPKVLVENGYNDLIEVEISVSLLVQQHIFFGNLPLEQVSGFKDELSGVIITNAFTTGIFNPHDVWDNWLRLKTADEAPQRPVMTLVGLVGYDPQGR